MRGPRLGPALALALALLLVSCLGPPPQLLLPTISPEPGVLSVTVLLDLSGDRAPRGDAQRRAIELWQEHDQARAGDRLRPRTRFVDVGGSDARLLIELRRAAGDERADAVVVGVPVSADTPGFLDAVSTLAVPVITTLPLAEPAAGRGGRWLFALAPTPEQIARTVAVFDPAPGLRDTYVATIEGRPRDPETSALLDEYIRRAGSAPIVLIYDRARPDGVAAVARPAAEARRVHLTGPPREWGPVASAVRQAGRPPGRFVLSSLAEPADLGELREGLDVVWPASVHLAPAATPRPAPDTPRGRFVRAYTDRHGLPSAHAAAAYDAIALLGLAVERAGTREPEVLRRQIESTTYEGAASTYAFDVARHASFSSADLALFRLAAGTLVVDLRR